MFELKITVSKVMGECTAHPPMKPGDHFTVSDGVIRIPEGGYICLWALQSLIPLITPKERAIAEEKDQDWMWRVHHAQCPDPKGRVVFKIEQVGKIVKNPHGNRQSRPAPGGGPPDDNVLSEENGMKSLRLTVEAVNGRCTSRMKPGDYLLLRSGRIYLPQGGHFCLYALQAALPLLPAKQRTLQDGDWLKEECRVLCPDPAGNVILRIERLGEN